MIARLEVAHSDALYALRQAALKSAPLAFGSAIGDDRMTPEFIRTILAPSETQAVFGHFATPLAGTPADTLSGMVGVLRSQRLKTAHRADISGMFVSPEARRSGAGRALLDAAITQCRAWDLQQVHLSVTSAAEPARQLYLAAGFKQWGTEPNALCWDGEWVDEHHLVLTL